jgi:hypothetical protein
MMLFWVKSSCGLVGGSDDFSPEDGDSTLLQSVGFYQPVYTVT